MRQASRYEWRFIFFTFIVLTLLLFLVYKASPQTSMGPIKSPQINQAIYVGQSGFGTIQSAVNYACRTGNHSFSVIIEKGITPPDTIAGVHNGCNTSTIADERDVPPSLYSWNGSAYVAVPPAGSAAIAKTYNLLSGDNTGQAIDSGVVVGQGGGVNSDAVNYSTDLTRGTPKSGAMDSNGHYFNCTLNAQLSSLGTTCFNTIDRYFYPGHNYGWGGVMSNIAGTSHASLGGSDSQGYSFYSNGSGIDGWWKMNFLLSHAGDFQFFDFLVNDRQAWVRGSDESRHIFRFQWADNGTVAGTITTGGANASKLSYTCTMNCRAPMLTDPVIDLNTQQNGNIGNCDTVGIPAGMGTIRRCDVTGITLPVSHQGTLSGDIDVPPDYTNSKQQTFARKTVTINIDCDISLSSCNSSGTVAFIQGPFLEVVRPIAGSIRTFTGTQQTFDANLYNSHYNGSAVAVGGFSDGYIEQAGWTVAHQATYERPGQKEPTTYKRGDLVTDSDGTDTYVSLDDNNKGNRPRLSPGKWLKVTGGGGFLQTRSYSRGEVVSFNGKLFYSTRDGNLRSAPGGTDGAWATITTPTYRWVERVLASPDVNSVWVGELQAGNLREFFGSNYAANFYRGGQSFGVLRDDGEVSDGTNNVFYLDGNSAPWSPGDTIQQTNHPSYLNAPTNNLWQVVNPVGLFQGESDTLYGGGALYSQATGQIGWKHTYNQNSPSLYHNSLDPGHSSPANGTAPWLWVNDGPTSGFYFNQPPMASGQYGSGGGLINVGHSLSGGGTGAPYMFESDSDTGAGWLFNPSTRVMTANQMNMLNVYDLQGHYLTGDALIAGIDRAGAGGTGQSAGVEITGWPGYTNARQWVAPLCLAEAYGGALAGQDSLAVVQNRPAGGFPACATALGGWTAAYFGIGTTSTGVPDVFLQHEGGTAPYTARLDSYDGTTFTPSGGNLKLHNIAINGTCTIGGVACATGLAAQSSGKISPYPLNSSGVKSKVVATTPPNSVQTCLPDAMWHDDSYIYVCTRSGVIKRAALQAFVGGAQ